MRSVKELAMQNRKVYVFLKDEETSLRFLQDAEAEGFTYGDGVKPTGRPGGNLYVLEGPETLACAGIIGHMAFQSARTVGGLEVIRVDYGRFLAGEEYLMSIPV